MRLAGNIPVILQFVDISERNISLRLFLVKALRQVCHENKIKQPSEKCFWFSRNNIPASVPDRSNMSTSLALELADKSSKAIDREIQIVLIEIKKKDAQIQQLNEEKIELTLRYEELKTARLRSCSAEIANERDWEKGIPLTSVIIYCSFLIIPLSLNRHIPLDR